MDNDQYLFRAILGRLFWKLNGGLKLLLLKCEWGIVALGIVSEVLLSVMVLYPPILIVKCARLD